MQQASEHCSKTAIAIAILLCCTPDISVFLRIGKVHAQALAIIVELLDTQVIVDGEVWNHFTREGGQDARELKVVGDRDNERGPYSAVARIMQHPRLRCARHA